MLPPTSEPSLIRHGQSQRGHVSAGRLPSNTQKRSRPATSSSASTGAGSPTLAAAARRSASHDGLLQRERLRPQGGEWGSGRLLLQQGGLRRGKIASKASIPLSGRRHRDLERQRIVTRWQSVQVRPSLGSLEVSPADWSPQSEPERASSPHAPRGLHVPRKYLVRRSRSAPLTPHFMYLSTGVRRRHV